MHAERRWLRYWRYCAALRWNITAGMRRPQAPPLPARPLTAPAPPPAEETRRAGAGRRPRSCRGGEALRGSGELRHSLLESDLGHEAQFVGGPAGGGDDVADVAGAPAADDLGAGRLRAEGVAQRHGHVEHRAGPAAGHVVGAGRDRRREGEHVGPGDIADVDEVPGLGPVLEHPRWTPAAPR